MYLFLWAKHSGYYYNYFQILMNSNKCLTLWRLCCRFYECYNFECLSHEITFSLLSLGKTLDYYSTLFGPNCSNQVENKGPRTDFAWNWYTRLFFLVHSAYFSLLSGNKPTGEIERRRRSQNLAQKTPKKVQKWKQKKRIRGKQEKLKYLNNDVFN